MNTTPSIAILSPERTDRIWSRIPWRWILVTHRNEASRSFHPFCFLFVCELVPHKSGAYLPLTQIIVDGGMRRVLANVQFLLNQSKRQSPILSPHLSHFLIISKFGLSIADWNVAHLQSFPFLRKCVRTILNKFSAHGLPPVHLHQHFTRLRCSFLQFVAELDVCTFLHYAVTLPFIITTFNWPQSVYTAGHMQSMLCVDSPHVSEEPWACMHMCAKLLFSYD